MLSPEAGSTVGESLPPDEAAIITITTATTAKTIHNAFLLLNFAPHEGQDFAFFDTILPQDGHGLRFLFCSSITSTPLVIAFCVAFDIINSYKARLVCSEHTFLMPPQVD